MNVDAGRPGGRSGVRVERTGPNGVVARVTIARPDARNALDAPVIATLLETFQSFASEPPEQLRAVILAGEGPVFCAGGDLAWMRAGSSLAPDDNVRDTEALAAMYTAIDRCPVPVIARVQGAALGGGAGFCCVVDVVVADAAATFGFPEVRIGLLPATVAPFVVTRLGEGTARALFVTGRRISAAEALRVGLVHEVADGPAALDAAVARVTEEVLAGGPNGVRAAKRLIRDVAAPSREESEALTARLLAEQRVSPEGLEGLRAVAERRAASWVPPDGE